MDLKETGSGYTPAAGTTEHGMNPHRPKANNFTTRWSTIRFPISCLSTGYSNTLWWETFPLSLLTRPMETSQWNKQLWHLRRTTILTETKHNKNTRQFWRTYKVNKRSCGWLIISINQTFITNPSLYCFYYSKHKIQFPLTALSITISRPQVRFSWWAVSRKGEAGISK